MASTFEKLDALLRQLVDDGTLSARWRSLQFTPDDELDAVASDSIAMMTLFEAVLDEFGVRLTEAHVVSLKTLGDLAKLLEANSTQ